jgi:hypothetical protein
MKIEFVTDKRVRSLGGLNSGTFFCKGCGIVPASDDCPICRNLTKREPRPSLLERLFPDRWFSTQVIVAAIVLIAIFVFVFNALN